MKTYGLLLVVMVLLTGCPMRQRMADVREGMSRQQVVGTLGPPDGFNKQEGQETLHYSHRLVSGWSNDRAGFYVILKEDKVIATGMGELRQSQNNVSWIIPLTPLAPAPYDPPAPPPQMVPRR